MNVKHPPEPSLIPVESQPVDRTIGFLRDMRAMPKSLASIASLQLCLVAQSHSIALLRLWNEICALVVTRMPSLKRISVHSLVERLHEAVKQGRMLRPLMGFRGLESFNLQLRRLPEGQSFWTGYEDTGRSFSSVYKFNGKCLADSRT